MRIINVIEVVTNHVVDVESYGVFEEQLSGEVVDDAEKYFCDRIKKFIGDDVIDEQDIEDALENGYYENSTKGYYIRIYWSYI